MCLCSRYLDYSKIFFKSGINPRSCRASLERVTVSQGHQTYGSMATLKKAVWRSKLKVLGSGSCRFHHRRSAVQISPSTKFYLILSYERRKYRSRTSHYFIFSNWWQASIYEPLNLTGHRTQLFPHYLRQNRWPELFPQVVRIQVGMVSKEYFNLVS